MKLKDINNAVLVWGLISHDGLKRLKQENCLVVVPENRPYLIGLKHNTPLLKKENIRFVYCTDNTLGMLFYKAKMKKTIVFCEKQKEKNIGICGSSYVCLLSRSHNLPVEFLPQGNFDFKDLDKSAFTLGGKSFVLKGKEEDCIITPESEVLESME